MDTTIAVEPTPIADSQVLIERAALRVLVAEDDKEMRRMIASALRRHGCHVVEAKNGMELLNVLGTGLLHPASGPPVDVIVSDFKMPGVTGLSVLAGLRGARWTTPFILITGFGGSDFQTRALRGGATAVLDKPLDIDELRRKVIETGRAHVEARRALAPSPGATTRRLEVW